jgi:cell division protein FtsW
MKRVIFATVVLSILGLLFVFEASLAEGLETFGNQYHFARRQAMWIGVGFTALLGAAAVPPSFWKKTAPFWYLSGILLLILVLIPGIGREFNGARRWISIGNITVLQPIEFVKFSVVVFFAAWMSKHQKSWPFLFLTGLPVGLILLQPDLGSSLILIAISFSLYFLAGGRIKIILTSLVVGFFILSAAIVSSDYRMRRVTTYLNPELDPLGAGFHIRQITLALGRGGITGQGIGNSRQKLSYIPEPSSDSIFAITAEEIGFLGSVVVIGIYALYLSGAASIVSKLKKKKFFYLLGIGIMVWITVQTLLNLAAVVALIPLTGLPLPFFSYGGSSIVMVLFATGILIRLDTIKT